MPGANPGMSYPAGTGLASPYQIALLAKQAGFPLSELPTAVAVALAESGGKIGATNNNTNGSTDYGLWQINSVHGYNSSQLTSDPTYNAQAAYQVWKSSGWGAWTTYKSGKYGQYWGEALSAANQATATTANKIFGALLPIVGIGAAASLPADAAAADASGTAADTAVGAGTGSTLTNLASKLGIQNIAKLSTGAILAEYLSNPSHLKRFLLVIGGIVLALLGANRLLKS